MSLRQERHKERQREREREREREIIHTGMQPPAPSEVIVESPASAK